MCYRKNCCPWAVLCSHCQGRGSVSVPGRCIALGERRSWAVKGCLLELHFFALVTTACSSLGLQSLRVGTATLPPSLWCLCGCSTRRGGQGVGKSITPLHCNEAERKLGYETVSGLRALLDVDLCREWEIMFQIVLILSKLQL